MAHALGGLDWTETVPDVLPNTQRQATGNLSTTFVVTQLLQERREFRLVDLYARQDWLALLVANSTEYLPDDVNEVNLFTFAAVQAFGVRIDALATRSVGRSGRILSGHITGRA